MRWIIFNVLWLYLIEWTSGQTIYDADRFYKPMTGDYDVINRGNLFLPPCMKDLMNCWELFRPDLVCKYRYDSRLALESICMDLRFHCKEHTGPLPITNLEVYPWNFCPSDKEDQKNDTKIDLSPNVTQSSACAKWPRVREPCQSAVTQRGHGKCKTMDSDNNNNCQSVLTVAVPSSPCPPPPHGSKMDSEHACRHACTRTPTEKLPVAKRQPCGVCPPCQAPCNPDAPPTPAEREAAQLAVRLQQTEESFKGKVTECAVLRAEVVRRKEEAERERALRAEATARLKELEDKFQLLGARALHMLGVKEQALEQEVAVSTLKQCYREAREEIDELRMLQAEQNLQVQDYRAKYQHAQQTIEEQKRQLALLDMDNTRISDQINLEIQRIKLKFQEKLSELSPLPEVLKATQRRLMEAQQCQALAEHKAENLTRELNTAREKVHMLLHSMTKPPAEKGPERSNDEKLVAMAQARAAQLAETNATLKGEIERLKLNVIRMEETVLATDKRLQEKMHECAALGGELERARDQATRAVLLANQKADTLRACLETTATDMERQLKEANAKLATAELDRDETQKRMQCQLGRLEAALEQAELRALALAAQAAALRRAAGGDEADAPDDQPNCDCKSFFDNN